MARRIATHPGGFIKRNYLEELGLTVSALAEALGIHRATLSRLLNEQTDLSPALALRLSMVLGGTPGSWMNLQTNHSLTKLEAEREADEHAWKPAVALQDGCLARHARAQQPALPSRPASL